MPESKILEYRSYSYSTAGALNKLRTLPVVSLATERSLLHHTLLYNIIMSECRTQKKNSDSFCHSFCLLYC